MVAPMDDYGALALVLASASFASLKRKRREQDPEYAAKEAERIAAKAEAKYEADYAQAQKDNDEFERSPRAFMRRLSKSIRGQS